jgi:hypothetical protein
VRGIGNSESGQVVGGSRASPSISARCPILGMAEGLFVEGTEGPLQEGEVERAAAWAKEIFQAAR